LTAFFNTIEDPGTLALAIVDTVREPLLVLGDDLRVLAVSRSYCLMFEVGSSDVLGQSLYALGDGQWRIPALGALLEKVLQDHVPAEGFEVDHAFSGIGRRTMLLNAREVFYAHSARTTLLLAFEDVTALRAADREKEELLRRTEELVEQKEVLLREMEHRVGNSLQIIASILMLKARTVTSEETRLHLQDVHQRVMAVAAVQQHLHSSERHDQIDIKPYLSDLCESLAASMIGASRTIALQVLINRGKAEYSMAVSLGLVVTELVINALKHAFPNQKPDCQVVVSYQTDNDDWTLVVSDNGVGKQEIPAALAKGGLGTSLVKALAQQLDAKVEVFSGPGGVRVTLTHVSQASRAA
jgi:chemotaxis protein methyltransferase CheR